MKSNTLNSCLLACTLAFSLALLAGCNMVKDTAETTERGGAGAGGVAKKMKSGTVGDTDMDTGESSSDQSDAGEGGGE